MHMVRSRKMEKVISVISSLFLIFGAVITAPFSIKDSYAAEIGLVGALAGETTLWEIAGTLFAGAGLILANNDMQQSAMVDLGSNSYTLDSLVQSGKINVPEGGSSALDPEEWDWSGLENDLANNTSSKDRKILEGVFGQTGGSSPSGGNDNEPWYKKFVRWVKAGVNQGAYLRSQYINTNNGQIELGLAYLAQALSSYFQNNVSEQIPVSANYSLSNLNDTMGYLYVQRTTPQNSGEYYFTEVQVMKKANVNLRCYFFRLSGNPKGKVKALIGSLEDERVYVGSIPLITTKLSTGGETTTNINQSTVEYYNAYAYWAIPSGDSYNLASYNTDDVLVLASNEVYESYADAVSAHQAYIQSGMINSSPDIMTPSGPAVNSPGVTWVPTPYIDNGEHLDIVPQPSINTYITTINNPENNPTPEYIAQVWTNTVDPFVGDANNDPNVTPVPNPNITTVPRPNPNPNVTPIPDTEPGGNDNPITVTQPDPMPVIEGGNADLPQIWDFFPFCIPSDIIEIYKLFEVDNDARAAPVIDWRFQNATFGIDYTFHIDFSIFDSVATLGRTLFLLLFIMTLLVGTRNLIWR